MPNGQQALKRFSRPLIIVVQSFSCVWLCDSMDYSMSGIPVLSTRVCWNWCPLGWWYHPTIPSSATLFSSCPQSFPPSGSLPMSWLFASNGQSIGASASASVLPMNIQGWFPLRLILVWSLCGPRSPESSPAPHSLKASILWHSAFFMVQLSQSYMTTGKNIPLTIQTFRNAKQKHKVSPHTSQWPA